MNFSNPIGSKTSFTRSSGIVISLIIAVFCAYNSEGIPRPNHSEVLNGVLTVFPVFLGFSLTVMTLFGVLDNSGEMLFADQLEIYRDNFERKLLLNAFIAMCYFVEIVLALFLRCISTDSFYYHKVWPLFVGLGVFSCVTSLLIPKALYAHYRERYDLIMQAVKKRERR